jgi:hypothetical protein
VQKLAMAKSAAKIDVLVLGEHPAAYLTAALLKHKAKYRVVHSTIPGERLPDRLVVINPDLFELHPLLAPLRRKLECRTVYGLRFLADDPLIRSEYRSKSAVASIGQYRDMRAAMQSLADAQGVEFANPRQLQIHRLNEQGLEVTLGSQQLFPKALVLGGRLPEAQERLLGLPDEWEQGIVRRYSFCMIRGTRLVEINSRPLIPMSLDLHGLLSWAWLLPGLRHVQFTVEQSMDSVRQHRPVDLLNHWAGVLGRHGVLKGELIISPEMVHSLDLPMGGALAHEGVANRTLLIGPAGGFYSASAEDVYPNCWSAIYAADVLKKAMKEPHLQDALQPYRHRWRTTLGDYLRGPQQNLRFLLPLVYRNQVMTNRMAEAILTGESVVR